MNSTLRKILNSRWAAKHTEKVLAYYPQPAQSLKRYALFSSSLDRFLFVDDFDLWSVEHAAKLLSSKLCTIVCVFSNEEPPMTIEDCLTWSLVEKSIAVPKKQMPELYLVKNNSEIIQEGPPLDFSGDLAGVVQDQEFALFVLKASYAMRLTDLYWNSSAALNNENQSFYTEFYAQELAGNQLQAVAEKTIWQKGFMTALGAIVYKALTVEEALAALSILYNDENFDKELSPYKQFYLKNLKRSLLYKQLYLKTFFEFLGWEPE